MPDPLSLLFRSMVLPKNPMQPEAADLRPIPADFAQKTMNYWDKYVEKHPISVPDQRADVPVTKRLHSEVSPELAKLLVEGAVKHHEDPATVLAMAMQEGNFAAENPLHSNFLKRDIHDKSSEDLQQMKDYDAFNAQAWDLQSPMWPHKGMLNQAAATSAMPRRPNSHTLDEIDQSLSHWQKLKAPLKDASPALQIQAYNGLGVIGDKKSYHSGNYYGKTGRIDMKETPLYGERVQALRDSSIATNPELQRLIQMIVQGKK